MYLASTKAHCDQTQLVALGEELGRDGRSVHGGDCSVIRSMIGYMYVVSNLERHLADMRVHSTDTTYIFKSCCCPAGI